MASAATAALALALAAGDAGPPPSGEAAPPARPPLLLLVPPGRSLQAQPAADEYTLKPARDGTGDLIHDAGMFQARVALDGTVTFTDRRLGDVSRFPLAPFLPMRMHFAVPSLESSARSWMRDRPPPPPPPPDDRSPPEDTTLLIPNVSRHRPDTRDACRGSCDFTPSPMVANVTGRMDLTDQLERLSDRDPHRLRKARFLAATREMRIGMAVKMHAASIRRATAALPGVLDAIAGDDRRSPKERRAILEALRDEMDPATPAGRAAAEAIARLIAARFTDDSPDGGAPPDGPPRDHEP
jgi:hypothetical protein